MSSIIIKYNMQQMSPRKTLSLFFKRYENGKYYENFMYNITTKQMKQPFDVNFDIHFSKCMSGILLIMHLSRLSDKIIYDYYDFLLNNFINISALERSIINQSLKVYNYIIKNNEYSRTKEIN